MTRKQTETWMLCLVALLDMFEPPEDGDTIFFSSVSDCWNWSELKWTAGLMWSERVPEMYIHNWASGMMVPAHHWAMLQFRSKIPEHRNREQQSNSTIQLYTVFSLFVCFQHLYSNSFNVFERKTPLPLVGLLKCLSFACWYIMMTIMTLVTALKKHGD